MHTVCQLLGWTGADTFHDFPRLQQQGAGRDESNADFAVVLRAWCCKYWAQPALLEAVRPARATPFSPGQQRRFRPLDRMVPQIRCLKSLRSRRLICFSRSC